MSTPAIILNNLAGHVRRGPVADRRHVDLAWVGLGIGNEFGNCLGRHRWIHHHDEGHADDARDRRDVANEIEIKIVVERRTDRCRRADHEQRIAVRLRIHDRLGSNIAAGTWPILDHEGLTETLRQPLSYQARGDVGRAPGGKADDQAHRPCRIALPTCDPRYG